MLPNRFQDAWTHVGGYPRESLKRNYTLMTFHHSSEVDRSRIFQAYNGHENVRPVCRGLSSDL